MAGRKTGITISFIMVQILVLLMGSVVFAGDINGNEAGVISAASGTFQYNGKSYRAGSAYINELVGYLSGDGVDLTAEQASEAISRMYGSVGEGVAQGYLYEVSGTKTPEEDQDATTETTTTRQQPEHTSTTQNTEATTEKATDTTQDIWKLTGENASQMQKRLEKRPAREQASVVIRMDHGKLMVTTEDTEHKESQTQEVQFRIPLRIYRIYTIASIVVACVILLSGCLLWSGGCLKRKSRREPKDHLRRRKLRNGCRGVLIASFVISAIGLFAVTSCGVGLFQKQVVLDNIQTSGYFQSAYAQYLLKQKDVAEGMEYEEFLFRAKEDCRRYLEGKTDTTILNREFLSCLCDSRETFFERTKIPTGIFVGSLIVGGILILRMENQKKRGLSNLLYSLMGTVAGMLLLTATTAIGISNWNYYVEPDYLYLYLTDSFWWIVKMMAVITAFGVVIEMAVVGIYRNYGRR